MAATSVLTTASSVTCVDGAAAEARSGAKLRVGQHAVLLFDQLRGTAIPSCPMTSSGSTKCTTIAELATGKAVKLRVGAPTGALQPVALETLTGVTDGLTSGVPRTVGAKAGQTRLRAG